MAKILKFWHQWSWAFHIGVWLIGGTTVLITYKDVIAENTKDIAAISEQKLPERMATQEQLSKDTGDRLTRMELVQGKIFDRINQIADKR